MYLEDGFRLTFRLADHLFLLRLCAQDCRLLFRLRFQNSGCLLTFRNGYAGFLLTFRPGNGLSSFTLRLHLLFHGVLYFGRRDNVLKLHTVHLDSPWVSCLVQGGPHLGIDGFSGGQSLIQLQIADDVTECGRRQIFNCHDRVFHSIGKHLGVGNLEKHHRINPHGYIILGDYRLGRKVHHLFL